MRRDDALLLDILQAAELILSFLEGVDYDEFRQNPMRHAAVIREFEIIGEATKRLSPESRDDLPTIPWTKMAGMRDVLIHAYERVDLSEVWAAAQTGVPALIAAIKPLVPPEQP